MREAFGKHQRCGKLAFLHLRSMHEELDPFLLIDHSRNVGAGSFEGIGNNTTYSRASRCQYILRAHCGSIR